MTSENHPIDAPLDSDSNVSGWIDKELAEFGERLSRITRLIELDLNKTKNTDAHQVL